MVNCLHEVSSQTVPSAQPLKPAQRDEVHELLKKALADPNLAKKLQDAMASKAQSTQAQIIRMGALSTRLGLAKSTLYKMIAEGKFPKGFSINGGKATGWLSTTIDQWLEERAA
jgi:prophage regulatory protein